MNRLRQLCCHSEEWIDYLPTVTGFWQPPNRRKMANTQVLVHSIISAKTSEIENFKIIESHGKSQGVTIENLESHGEITFQITFFFEKSQQKMIKWDDLMIFSWWFKNSSNRKRVWFVSLVKHLKPTETWRITGVHHLDEQRCTKNRLWIQTLRSCLKIFCGRWETRAKGWDSSYGNGRLQGFNYKGFVEIVLLQEVLFMWVFVSFSA